MRIISGTHKSRRIIAPNNLPTRPTTDYAKEALFKSLGTGWAGDLKFNEVEVYNDDLGKPSFRFFGKTKTAMQAIEPCAIHLSISHISEYATAYVVIESTDSRIIEP